MDSAELHSKKRKRKHSSAKPEKEDAVVATNGSSPAPEEVEVVVKKKRSKEEKALKKAKKAHKAVEEEEIIEDEIALEKPDEDAEDAVPEADEAADAQWEDEDAEDLGDGSADLAEGALADAKNLSLPDTGVQAKKFSELNLSEKTMKARDYDRDPTTWNTTFAGWERCAGCCEDWFGKDFGLLDPCH